MQYISTEKGSPGRFSETTLWPQAQAGCRTSVNRLMSQRDGLVHAVVRQQVLGQLAYEEALQAGRIGLWRAILGYDPEHGTAFSTYAWVAIMRSVAQLLARLQFVLNARYVSSGADIIRISCSPHLAPLRPHTDNLWICIIFWPLASPSGTPTRGGGRGSCRRRLSYESCLRGGQARHQGGWAG